MRDAATADAPAPRPRAGARQRVRRRATSTAPTSAPATVPTLKPAWKRGMIVRPGALDLRALDVHRDVPARRCRRRRRTARRRQRHRARPAEAATSSPPRRAAAPPRDHGRRAEPRDQPPGRRQREHRAGRDREQQQPELAVGRARASPRTSGIRETQLAKSSPLRKNVERRRRCGRRRFGSASALFQSGPGGPDSSQDWKPISEALPHGELEAADGGRGAERRRGRRRATSLDPVGLAGHRSSRLRAQTRLGRRREREDPGTTPGTGPKSARAPPKANRVRALSDRTRYQLKVPPWRDSTRRRMTRATP